MSQVLEICSSDSIQEALKFLNRTQGGILRLLPGVYMENVFFPSDVTIQGSGLADLGFTTIVGHHLLPPKGRIGFDSIRFENEKSCFTNRRDKNLLFVFKGCSAHIESGYFLDIPGSIGNGIFFDCWIQGQAQGFVNNEGGDVIFKFFNMTSESAENELPCIVPKSALFFNAHITHDIVSFGEDVGPTFEGGCWIESQDL